MKGKGGGGTQNTITGPSQAGPAESGRFSNIKSIKTGYKLTRSSGMADKPKVKGS